MPTLVGLFRVSASVDRLRSSGAATACWQRNVAFGALLRPSGKWIAGSSGVGALTRFQIGQVGDFLWFCSVVVGLAIGIVITVERDSR